MAKWGEGDPRWIVEQRADATNVNNWHWTERDASNWSTEKLKALLLTIKVENAEGICEVTEVSKLDGEASINNRKGKLIFFYEWNIKLTWTGTSLSEVKYKGYVEIPNLSDENDVDEIEISVSLAKDEPDTNLLALMRKEGAEKIRNALGTYISTLKTEFTQGMILPTVNGEQLEPALPPPSKAEQRNTTSTADTAALHSKSIGVKIPTCKINLKEVFLTSPEELYRVFITQEVPEKQIAMKWRFKSWPVGHFATITLTFADKGGETEVHLEGKGIPANEEERTREGWRHYYFEGINQTFGYGAHLF
uniref:Activator of HSP90 ATPase activity 1 n=1 Tax=Sphenodon punctatus TaxID=8508 RepID=A0A8D0GZF8_SPHPU